MKLKLKPLKLRRTLNLTKIKLKKSEELAQKEYLAFKYILEQLDKHNQRILELENNDI